jgi:hypothetical protein
MEGINYKHTHSADNASFSGVSFFSFAPAFLPVSRSTPWELLPDRAFGRDVSGWMPLQLPHGAKIQTLTVDGHVSPFSQLTVQLARLTFPNDMLSLTTIKVREPGPVEVTSQIPDDLSVIDNAKNQYSITAEAFGLSCDIFGLRISCMLG